MSLSPEERQRIYEEEKARIEGSMIAYDDPVADSARRLAEGNKVATGCFWIGAVIFGIWAWGMISNTGIPANPIPSAGMPEVTGVNNSSQAAISPTKPVAPLKWQKVAVFSGHTNKNTETFEIRGNEWHVVWATRPDDENTNFIVDLNTEDGQLKDQIANVIGKGSETTVERGPGRYYLSVMTSQRWAIGVEEYR